MESSEQIQWELLSVIDNSQRGSGQRKREKCHPTTDSRARSIEEGARKDGEQGEEENIAITGNREMGRPKELKECVGVREEWRETEAHYDDQLHGNTLEPTSSYGVRKEYSSIEGDMITNIDVVNDSKIAERSVEVTNKELCIDWKGYGLRLHIPPNSLPKHCSHFQLKMAVSRANNYKLLAGDGILVSAIYSFHHNLGDKRLRRPATLKMQHCIASDSYVALRIIQSNGISPPYHFKTVPGGKFDMNDGYGEISVDHFCCFGIYLEWFHSYFFPKMRFCAMLYYVNLKVYSFDFHLYISPHVEALIKVCSLMVIKHLYNVSFFTLQEIEDDVMKKNSHYKAGPILPIEFDEKTRKIYFDLPKDPISGWKMKYLNTKEVGNENVQCSVQVC